MRETSCDVLIVGGGVGGCAAAMAACSLGMRVILTEETDWVGGQLTAQAVPPDEHPWIEQFGCTARYRRYRNLVRRFYRDHTPLLPAHRANPQLNPGAGWVSRLCHEPRVSWLVLNDLLQEHMASGRLEIRLGVVPQSLEASPALVPPASSRVESVPLKDLRTGDESLIHARYVLDATETGILLKLTGTEYVTGAESKAQTAEPNAVDGAAQPQNMQAITWVFAMAHDEGSHRVIEKPESYEQWKAFQPSFWPGPWLSLRDLNPHTLEVRDMPLFSEGPWCWFKYRQIVEPSRFAPGHAPHPVTIVNWPLNDYLLGSVIDVDEQPTTGVTPYSEGPISAQHLLAAKDLGRSLLYFLQTEAPRPDGGMGYPGLYLRPDITGTDDGFAKGAYVRESRRIVARHTVREQDVAAYTNPGMDRAPKMKDSVGVGAYRIDLHPSTGGDNYIDTSSLPFQIPLGALITVRMRNLLPACKNLGVTHITNGCYRLHPVEWNIGEAAGALAAFCILRDKEPAQVYESAELTEEFQGLLRAQGVEIEWPELRAL